MKKLVKKVLIEERDGGKVKVYKKVYEEVPDKPAPKKPAPKKAAPKKVEEPKVEEPKVEEPKVEETEEKKE